MKIIRRTTASENLSFPATIHPLLQRIYAGRGIAADTELNYKLSHLCDYQGLKDIEKAADIISHAVVSRQKILVVGDFDADGATSSALAVTALRSFSANQPDYLVPNRFEFGYGLTPEIVEVAAANHPDIIVTVDNGISSIEGVKAAEEKGIKVVVTDHHLAGSTLPEAAAIVNPNQPGCSFPGKNTAGVGVIFYVMCAVRARLKKLNWFNAERPIPNMAPLLDLVALGTVADVVSFDKNNRIFVYHGLERIKADYVRPGILALIEVSQRQQSTLTAGDLGFALGPRLNAAGRLDDMSLGIELLLSGDITSARQLAVQLDKLNTQRRSIEDSMRIEAEDKLHELSIKKPDTLITGLCLYQEDWHQGIIGIVASRIKEQIHCPVIAFAPSECDRIKGSARSINGFHIRDALADIASSTPGLLCSYGGHAMAAGLTIKKEDFEYFNREFQRITKEKLNEDSLMASLVTDGELKPEEHILPIAIMLRDAGPWGQHFPEPLFDGTFRVINQKLLKNKHLKFVVTHPASDQWIDAILFNADLICWPDASVQKVFIVYKLDINDYRGSQNIQIIVKHMEAVK